MMAFPWLLGATFVLAAEAWCMSSVERVRAQDFDADQYYRDRVKPLLISNVLSTDECEYCSDVLVSLSAELQVDVQSQSREGTEILRVSLEEALDLIQFQSNSQNAYLSFCEGLLESHDSLHPVRDLVTHAKEGLFPDDADWFTSHFPRELQPSDAVVIAGAGATSTLHRDPFEWMGTSLCIEGSKIWRFIDPKLNVEKVDKDLSAYRLESIAWEGTSVSAGWQSNYSLFANRRHDLLYSAQEWSEMEHGKRAELQRLGSSTEILTPGLELELPMITAVQEVGELLLIPAHWWHQTYALEPSAAVASQRCGNRDSLRVIQHILDYKQEQSDDARTILERYSDPARALEAVLSVIGK